MKENFDCKLRGIIHSTQKGKKKRKKKKKKELLRGLELLTNATRWVWSKSVQPQLYYYANK